MCAFCLFHEADRLLPSASPAPQMSVEHIETRKSRRGRRNDYANCAYACMWCNRSRGIRPIENEDGARLLNPETSVWADHFVAEGNRLRPRLGDANASYTHETYGLDDARKVELRKLRAEHFARCMRKIQEGPGQLRTLAKVLEGVSADEKKELRALAEALREEILGAWKELERYRPIPVDAGPTCHCATPPAHEVIDVLTEQMVSVSPPEAFDAPAPS